MNEERLLTMLGFAMRAGKLTVGTEQVCQAMPKQGSVRLVLICQDSSDGTKKKLSCKSEFYGIKSSIIALTQDKLGKAIGKTSSPACVGVRDEGFAEQMLKAINS